MEGTYSYGGLSSPKSLRTFTSFPQVRGSDFLPTSEQEGYRDAWRKLSDYFAEGPGCLRASSLRPGVPLVAVVFRLLCAPAAVWQMESWRPRTEAFHENWRGFAAEKRSEGSIVKVARAFCGSGRSSEGRRAWQLVGKRFERLGRGRGLTWHLSGRRCAECARTISFLRFEAFCGAAKAFSPGKQGSKAENLLKSSGFGGHTRGDSTFEFVPTRHC